ncbi:long-chain fatty acid--CoA ligase, partial [Gordonia terrae]
MGIELIANMAADALGDRIVLGSRTSGITASRLRDHSVAGGEYIRETGARTVAFVGLNGPILTVALLAATQAEVPLTPLNYRLSAEAIRSLLD